MRAPARPLLVIVLALTVVAPAVLSAPAPSAAPGEGADAGLDAPWWERTRLDGDGDGVDDALEARAAAATAAGDGPVRALVSYAAPPTAGERAAVEDAGATILDAFTTVPVLLVEAPAERLPHVAAAPGVKLVEADRALQPTLDESRALLRADQAASRHGLTGAGVTVAVLDTGVDATHPDLDDRVRASFDATVQRTLITRLLGSQRPVVAEYTDGHGTHVAGIVAGTGDESDGRYQGVAPGAGILNVKVFDATGNGSTSYVLRGIDWVVENKDRHGVRVMQMSLGGKPTDGTDALSRAVDVATQRGLLTVASAGNQGPDPETVGVPGVASRALTVGAVDKKLLRAADFSARGPTIDGRRKPDVVAPGVAITSAVPPTASGGANYEASSGTSMAAPHVAGAAALVFEANGSLSPAMAKWILVSTARGAGPTPQAWHAAYGWGMVDAEAAARAAKNPAILGQPPFESLASQVPFDGGESPISQLRFEAEKAQRWVPAPGTAVALAAGALALAFRAGAGAGSASPRRRN